MARFRARWSPLLLALAVLMPVIAQGDPVMETLYRFPSSMGPQGSVILDNAGNVYGTSTFGGRSGAGTVFKVAPNGQFTMLVDFPDIKSGYPEGSYPSAGLVFGADGNLYGTTWHGGADDRGVVFKITPAGVKTTLASFSGTNGAHPLSALIAVSDGCLYGTTSEGGAHDAGAIFKIDLSGSLTLLASFDGANGGKSPEGRLVLAHDNNFYGTTHYGGTHGLGTVFQMKFDGTLTTLVNFSGDNGASPVAGLTTGPANNDALWGTTSEQGFYQNGTVFMMTLSGALQSFHLSGTAGLSNGGAPKSDLILGADNIFYGTTSTGGTNNCGTIFRITPALQLTPLVHLSLEKGAGSAAGLVQDMNGKMYGTTFYGGVCNYGTVFKLTPPPGQIDLAKNTQFSTLAPMPFYPFPNSLVQAKDGTFYGTTVLGGTGGCGSIFSLTADGAFSLLASFTGTSGIHPGTYPSPLASGSSSDPNFYGTTVFGGAGDCGTLFKVTPAGALTTLVTLTGNTGAKPGKVPYMLTWGNNGWFYGITSGSGATPRGFFRMSPAGAYAQLATWARPASEIWPMPEQLTLGSDGKFYGADRLGGSGTAGAIFSLTATGVRKVLAEFPGAGYLGDDPYGALVVNSDGSLYGTTGSGGLHDRGTIFKMAQNGTITTLVSFAAGAMGFDPEGVVLGPDHNLYGTTAVGTDFRMLPSGSFTTIEDLPYDSYSCEFTNEQVMFGADGNLYGTRYDSIYRIVLTTAAPTVGRVYITPSKTTASASVLVHPGGVATVVAFYYGKTLPYTNHTGVTTLAAGCLPHWVTMTITGLAANTSYHVRAGVNNVKGTAYSQDLVFKTLP